ncbi:hypothetical protein GE09DRAFT_1289470 [Coniochaeta sp. 2T2.1]|nr:hypothetical protein GE09DRAFT_1289470 [Coniochaeta sp. 2T2.1]
MADKSNPRVRKAVSQAGLSASKKHKAGTSSTTKPPTTDQPRVTRRAARQQQKDHPTVQQRNAKVSNDARAAAPFAWKACTGDANDLKRLQTKEEAVSQGLYHAGRIRSYIQLMAKTLQKHGGTTFQSWVAQLDDLEKQNDAFRVAIGFVGATEAGKTSVINALLGFRDLLPSSNQATATAVPCTIAYNNSPDPAAAFAAQIKFRTEQDIRQTLEYYFDAIATADESAEAAKADPSASASLNDSGTADEDVSDLLEMVSVVFNIDEAALRTETAGSLMAKHPDVRRLLGTTKTVKKSQSEVEAFSESIRPYMDSVTAVHGDTGVEFAAWPLIDVVYIFVKSDVLKNGVVLVDLPGLADSTQSRGRVAQEFFAKLSVTAIVAPVVRALNEQTATTLMTDNQQLRLQMDGSFHKKAFCMVLSKMDDIEVETHLKQQSGEARSDQTLEAARASLKALEEEFKTIQAHRSQTGQELKDIRRKLRHAEAHNLEQYQQDKSKSQVKLDSLDLQQQRNRKKAKDLNGLIRHWCITSRNAFVKKHMQQDFKRRQQRLAAVTTRPDLYDGDVNIFPVSSTAYWQVTQDTESPIGFPAKEYTGVPALQHWLRYAAIPERERHLNMVLNALHGLYNTMHTWSSASKASLRLTKKFVNDEVLHRPLEVFTTALTKRFSKLGRDIKALNPIKNKGSTVANCKDRCIRVVEHWAALDPDKGSQSKQLKRMRWPTYNACIARGGEVFIAKKGPRYAWVESLCNLFYEDIVGEWNLVLNEQVPALEPPTLDAIEEIWTAFMRQLEKRASVAAPQLLTAESQEKLSQIQLELRDLVSQDIRYIRDQARKAHLSVKDGVKAKWEPAFKRAKKEPAGKARFARQEQILVDFAARRGANMFKEATDQIAENLGAQLSAAHRRLARSMDEIRMRLANAILLILKPEGEDETPSDDNNSQENHAAGPRAAEKRNVQEIMLQWEAMWRMRTEQDTSLEACEAAIPDSYYVNAEDAEDADDDEDSSTGRGLVRVSSEQFLGQI